MMKFAGSNNIEFSWEVGSTHPSQSLSPQESRKTMNNLLFMLFATKISGSLSSERDMGFVESTFHRHGLHPVQQHQRREQTAMVCRFVQRRLPWLPRNFG